MRRRPRLRLAGFWDPGFRRQRRRRPTLSMRAQTSRPALRPGREGLPDLEAVAPVGCATICAGIWHPRRRLLREGRRLLAFRATTIRGLTRMATRMGTAISQAPALTYKRRRLGLCSPRLNISRSVVVLQQPRLWLRLPHHLLERTQVEGGAGSMRHRRQSLRRTRGVLGINSGRFDMSCIHESPCLKCVLSPARQ
jgi:hypothetical protein